MKQFPYREEVEECRTAYSARLPTGKYPLILSMRMNRF
jgi:hypothetical protein